MVLTPSNHVIVIGSVIGIYIAAFNPGLQFCLAFQRVGIVGFGGVNIDGRGQIIAQGL